MKKLLLLCLLILPASSCIAQVLSVDQLLSIYNKDEEQIDAYLGARGWERTSSVDPKSIKTWAYDKQIDPFSVGGTEPGLKYQAKGWFSLVNDEEGYWLSYSISSKERFVAIRQRIIAMGMKRVSYTSDNDMTVATYQGTRYAIRLVTIIDGDNSGENNYSLKLAVKN